MTNESYRMFRNMVKEVGGKIKGNMSEEDMIAANTALVGQLVLHFRSWASELILERVKPTKINRILKTHEEGRYRGLLKAAGYGREMVEDDRKLGAILLHGLTKGLSAAQHLVGLKQFITNPAERLRLKEANKWTPKMEKDYNRRTNALKREFEQWRRSTPGVKGIANENAYLRMRQRSVKRALGEVRALLILYAAIFAMGLGGEDDEFRNRNFRFIKRKK